MCVSLPATSQVDTSYGVVNENLKIPTSLDATNTAVPSELNFKSCDLKVSPIEV